MKFFNRHLEFERIIKAAETESAAFSADERLHLGNCAECSAQQRKLENFFSIAPKSVSEPVSQAATANLLNIFLQPATQTKRSFANRLAGLLIFDDWKPEFALNERLSFQDTRQFLYRAGDYSIDLRVRYAADKCFVSGQLFPENPSAVVRIYNAKYSAEASLNEYGEFDFAPVEQGIYQLQIILGDETIEINDISLS